MANGKSDGSVIIDTKIDTSEFSKGMADAKQKVSAFSSSLNKLGNTIKSTFSQSNTVNIGKSYDELRKEIAKAESQLDRLIEKQIRFVETGGNIKSRAMEGMEYDIEMARQKLEGLRGQLALTSQETPKKVGKMKKWIEILKKSFNSLDRASKKSHYSILKMLGTSLLFSTVFRAISIVTQGFAEGINNLAQYSDKANGTMSALKSSLTQLKNSFATAFMPIITAVTPAITQFMALISKATSVVASFFAALTGNKTYTKAIEVQEDYAASLDKTADSAKKAQKYLSGLDEIRTFTEKETDTSGVVEPANMFTEEKIDTPILEFAEKVRGVIDKIKTFIKNEDWEGLGEYISDGLIGALNFLSERIDEFDWEGLGKDIGEFIKGIKWLDILDSVGKLIWEAINAGIELWKGMFSVAPIETAILTALATLKFTGAGKKILDGLSKTIATETGLNAGLSVVAGAFAIGATIYVAFKLAEDAKKWWANIQKYGWDEGRRKTAEENLANPYRNGNAVAQEDGSGWLNGWLENIKEWQAANREARDAEKAEAQKYWADLADSISEWQAHNREVRAQQKEEATQFWNELGEQMSEWWDENVAPWGKREKWEDALGGIKEAFHNIFKNAVNNAIEIINKLIDFLNDKMHFEWDPITIMGKEIVQGGSVQLFTMPKIPMLATGAVIPPNAPFMAILGDQRHGTNIETPEALLRKVVREESGSNRVGGSYTFQGTINRRVLFEEFIEEAKLQMSMTGHNPLDLLT